MSDKQELTAAERADLTALNLLNGNVAHAVAFGGTRTLARVLANPEFVRDWSRIEYAEAAEKIQMNGRAALQDLERHQQIMWHGFDARGLAGRLARQARRSRSRKHRRALYAIANDLKAAWTP